MVHQFRSTAEVSGWLLFISTSFSLSEGPASGLVTVEGIDVTSKRPKDGNLKRIRRYNGFLLIVVYICAYLSHRYFNAIKANRLIAIEFVKK